MLNAQAAMNANGYSPFGSSAGSSRFKRGQRVILLDGKGNNTAPEANPKWGLNGEFVGGVVQDSGGTYTVVRWDNGWENMFDSDFSSLDDLANAPQPKKKFFGGDKVELDTTKLDALVIDPEIKIEIVALLQQHKHAKKIFDDWGLGEVIEYGRGMTLMFWGSPGTGKTFGAKCIAKALGKELLIISASEIQSSEPGGANRNIQNAFSEASSMGKILFIDECDSLIANRANLGMILASEINTLLTEIEKMEGVVILATNRISDMDSALERRISLIVEFPNPTEEQRRDIWKGLLPKKMPLNSDVKIEELATYELSGGLIKNVVLQAARLALSDDAREVAMRHFDKAIKRTTESSGLMGKDRLQTREDFGRSGGSVGITKRGKVPDKVLTEVLKEATI